MEGGTHVREVRAQKEYRDPSHGTADGRDKATWLLGEHHSICLWRGEGERQHRRVVVRAGSTKPNVLS